MKEGNFPIKKIKFNRTFVIFAAVFILLVLYITFQYRAAIFNPPLNVVKPIEGEVVSAQEVTVVGKTDPNSTVYVNEEVASLDKKGNFKKTISVFPGTETITIKAVNNFHKTTIVERQIEVK